MAAYRGYTNKNVCLVAKPYLRGHKSDMEDIFYNTCARSN